MKYNNNNNNNNNVLLNAVGSHMSLDYGQLFSKQTIPNK
jgi:hypothetical protein